MASLSSRTHTLRGPQPTGIGLRLIVAGMDRTDDYEGLTYGNSTPGGFGPCQFTVRSAPPNFGDPINITVNGQEAWTGTVSNTPNVRYIGEKEPVYTVIADGPGKADAAAQSSDFAMAFVDRNVSNWANIDCDNWGYWSNFKLDCSSGDFLRIGGADFAEPGQTAMVWENGFVAGGMTYMEDGEPLKSNTPPESWSDGQFPETPILWAAFYYEPNLGVTADTISLFECSASYDLSCPEMDVLLTDWGSGEVAFMHELDEDGAWALDPITHQATVYLTYPPGHPQEGQNIPAPKAYWGFTTIKFITELYGQEIPGCLYAGIYAIDDPAELPVRDSIAMWDHSTQLHRFDAQGDDGGITNPGVRLEYHEGDIAPPNSQVWYDPDSPIDIETGLHTAYWVNDDGSPIYAEGQEPAPVNLSLDCGGKKMLVFYMTYKPLRLPYPFSQIYVEDEDEFYLTTWKAVNQVFLKSGSFVKLDNVSVYCNGFTGSNVSLALNMITPGEYPSFSVDEKTSIMVEPFTTRLAAIQSLLQLFPEPVVWGYWNGVQQLEASVYNYGTVYFDANEPGVTVEATLKKQDDDTSGETVGSMTVVYAEGHGPSDNRTIHTWTAKKITIDADGIPGGPTKTGYLDLSGTAHSAESAMGAGISYIAASGGSRTIAGGMQWEGSITLRAIYGAALLRAGYLINCGDVESALITNVSVNVDGDSVSLSLGGTGYAGRFAPAAGLGPNSATPFQSQVMLPFKSIGSSRRG